MKSGLLCRALLALAMVAPTAASLATPPVAPETAWDWLERMLQAARNLHYEGTFVYQHGGDLETLRIIRGHGPSGEWQRLVSLSGPPREVVVAGAHTYWLTPSRQVAFADDYPGRFPLPSIIPRQRSLLENHYELSLLAEDRVAGIPARLIVIKPRDTWRFGYRLWLDPHTGIALRAALLDEKGHPIEQMIFTEFRPKSSDDSAAPILPDSASAFALLNAPVGQAALSGGPTAVSPPTASDDQPTDKPTDRSRWRIDPIPAGFSPVSQRRFIAPSGQPAEHLVFSDGLATISIFLERLEGEAPLLRGASRWGSMNAFGVVVAGYQALVVGEAPAATVRQIAVSIQRTPDASPP